MLLRRLKIPRLLRNIGVPCLQHILDWGYHPYRLFRPLLALGESADNLAANIDWASAHSMDQVGAALCNRAAFHSDQNEVVPKVCLGQYSDNGNIKARDSYAMKCC